MKKTLMIIVLLASTTKVLPYAYTFYNATTAPVWIDPFWERLGLAEEQMFRGEEPTIEYKADQVEWTEPTRIKGPIQLLPNKRYTFKFTEPWNAGLCFSRLYLGSAKDNTVKADVKIAKSDQYNRIMDSANVFTEKTAAAAKDVGKAAAEFGEKGKAVQAVASSSGDAAEKLVSGITDLLAISQCGNLDFLIATDETKKLTAVIQK